VRPALHAIPRALTPLLLLALAAGVPPLPAPAAEPISPAAVRYTIDAVISAESATVVGSVRLELRNASSTDLREAVFLLYPNRFSQPDEQVDDFNRAYVYPREQFEPGRIEIVSVNGAPFEVADGATSMRVPIAPLPPGGTRTLTVAFRTSVPYRFGSFGHYQKQLTLNGGWHPYLAALDTGGRWRTELPPPTADFDVTLRRAEALELVAAGEYFERGTEPAMLSASCMHYLSVVAAPDFVHDRVALDGTEIVILGRSRGVSSRLAPGPGPRELVEQALRAIVTKQPPPLGSPLARLLVVAAPLRLRLTAESEGFVLISDRTLKVNPQIRPFHEVQLAQAVYAEMIRPSVARREPTSDYVWVREGVSRELARRHLEAAYPGARSVKDWIRIFDIFSVVDRFEKNPQIPFTESFFEHARTADPLHAQITSFNNDLPPGRVVMGKLDQWVQRETFDRVIDDCTLTDIRLRDCASEVSGQDLEPLFDQWLQRYPAINYRFGTLDLDQPAPSGYRSVVQIKRDSSREIVEPVTVRLRARRGAPVDTRWEGHGSTATLEIESEEKTSRVVIDPADRLIEDRLDDNARRPQREIVVGAASVEVSSTDFGVGMLVIGRNRGDYHKDLGLAGIWTDRWGGFVFGPRLHFGPVIDATRYRHNLYGFYTFQALASDFRDKSRPLVRNNGNQTALGLRYDFTNVLFANKATRERRFGLFVDWFDDALGGDYDYVRAGARAAFTQPLGSYRTIAALELLNGFNQPLGDGQTGQVPIQGQYSLGGSRSIRGIGAREELERNILLIRAELRQAIYPEVDLNLLDLLVMRRAELRVFVDAGRVDDDPGGVYKVGQFAVGVGIGLAAHYDFMGFFPHVAFLELATRVDESGPVEVLFGSSQRF
jgi:hypothetical protein